MPPHAHLPETPASAPDTAGESARQVARSTPMRLLARAGLLAYGLVHLVIGLIALRIAWGNDPNEADQSGAMQSLATQPFGTVLLWILAVGMSALASWHASRAIWAFRSGGAATRARRRLAAAATAVVYVGLAATAANFALGTRVSAAEAQQSTAEGVLALPFGQPLVIAVAIVVIAIGLGQLRKAARRRFTDEIDSTSMSAAAVRRITRVGRIGYAAKGAALAVVGGLLGYAAFSFDASKARGLDGAMRTIVVQPFGQVLLTAVAIGFIAFGLYTFAQSRYRPM